MLVKKVRGMSQCTPPMPTNMDRHFRQKNVPSAARGFSFLSVQNTLMTAECEMSGIANLAANSLRLPLSCHDLISEERFEKCRIADVVIPENLIRADSRHEAESAHHST